MCLISEYDTAGGFLGGEDSSSMPKDNSVYHVVFPGCALLRIIYP